MACAVYPSPANRGLPRPVLQPYHQISHGIKLRHIDAERGFRRHILEWQQTHLALMPHQMCSDFNYKSNNKIEYNKL